MVINQNLIINNASQSDGYLKCSVKKPSTSRHKIRVAKDGTVLSYDINNTGKFETIPLQLGNGKYVVKLYKNVSGKKYSCDGTISLNVTLKNELVPFMNPNQFVNYEHSDSIISKARELVADTVEKIIDNVINYIAHNYVYDYVKAIMVKPGVMPDIDTCFKKKMGICQDLAALTVALLRINKVPAKFVIGYKDNQYHAWTEIIKNDKWTRFDPTAAVTGSTDGEYTVERWY